MRYLIAVDLSFRSTGIVVLDSNKKVLKRATIKIDKSYSLDKDFKECLMSVETQLKKLDLDKSVQYDVVVELTKSNWMFPTMLGVYSAKLQFLYGISRFYFVSPNSWHKKLLNNKPTAKKKELKSGARKYASQFMDVEDWSEDEVDAFCVGVYWLEKV